jgi:hypothetical protein
MVLNRFKRKNEENVEANQKCQYASQAAAQWLGLRLQFIGVAMVTGIGLIAVLQHQFDVADPGICGNKLGNICIKLQLWHIRAIVLLAQKPLDFQRIPADHSVFIYGFCLKHFSV